MMFVDIPQVGSLHRFGVPEGQELMIHMSCTRQFLCHYVYITVCLCRLCRDLPKHWCGGFQGSRGRIVVELFVPNYSLRMMSFQVAFTWSLKYTVLPTQENESCHIKGDNSDLGMKSDRIQKDMYRYEYGSCFFFLDSELDTNSVRCVEYWYPSHIHTRYRAIRYRYWMSWFRYGLSI